MARIDINSIRNIEKNGSVHTQVTATYSTFEKDGNKYLQLDTYGTDKRTTEKKVSQSFQIDRETALFLVKLLVNEFEISFTVS